MIVEQMYEDVRQDVEANTPDSYVSLSNLKKDKSGGTMPNPGIAKLANPRRLKEKSSAEEVEEKAMRLADKAADHIYKARYE